MKSPQYLILPTPWATPSPITLPLNTTLIVLMPTDWAERQKLKFNSNNSEAYNAVFSVDELSKAITKSSDSAVGPDDAQIRYKMLKHLPESALPTLLHIINKHWCSESFPSIWHHAVVLQIRLTKIKLIHTATAR